MLRAADVKALRSFLFDTWRHLEDHEFESDLHHHLHHRFGIHIAATSALHELISRGTVLVSGMN